MSEDKKKSNKKWFPLESNPQVLNEYIKRMGFPTESYQFCDVLSTEEWALAMVPKPVKSVIMLFPIKDASEEHRKQEAIAIEANGQIVSPNLYYMKQTVGNACGTVGLLHACGNARNDAPFVEGSFLQKFVAKSFGKTPEEIAEMLENDQEIEETHASVAQEGQSRQVESVNDPVNTHFVCFSVVEGCLYELDGRKKFPINHGSSSPDTLLEDSCGIIKKFMARDEGEMRFTILALSKVQKD